MYYFAHINKARGYIRLVISVCSLLPFFATKQQPEEASKQMTQVSREGLVEQSTSPLAWLVVPVHKKNECSASTTENDSGM